MKPGRTPKPTIIKAAAGNPGKRRLNDHEPIPPAGEIEPPPWITDTARKVWDQMAPIARTMKVLTTADVLSFARYCDTFGQWLDLREKIRTKFRGETTYTRLDEKGAIAYVGEIPHASTCRRLELILIRYEEEFGFTPAARSRIKVDMTAGMPGQPAASTPLDEARRRFFESRGRIGEAKQTG